MTIKLKELLDSEKYLSELLQQPLPVRISYHLGKLVKKVGSELSEFYNQRDNLIKRLGTPDENGGYSISPDNQEAVEKFTKEISELVEVEVDLYNFHPIAISELMNTNVQLTAIQMSALSAFFGE